VIDYSKIIAANRSATPKHAASVPVFYETRLTRKKKSARLTGKRATEKRTTRRHSRSVREAAMAKSKLQKNGGKSKKPKRPKVKSPRKASRTATAPAPAPAAPAAPAKRKNPKRVAAGKKAAAARKRKEAAAARKRKGGSKRKSSGKRKPTSGGKRKNPKRVAAGKKAAATRKRNKNSGKRKSSPRKSGKRKSGHRKTKRAVSFRVPRKTRRIYVVASERRRRRRGAMENPLSGVELFIGSLLGLTGFAAGDLTDRLIATHALTGTAAPYTDTAPTTGSYAGLLNPTAICAPMNLPRWANAVGVPAVGFVVAHFVKGPVVRSALQFFAFGYGVRGVGKAVIDLLAKVTTNMPVGQRLYDGEMRAMLLKSGGGTIPAGSVALPSAGLGAPRQLGAPCACGGGCAKCKPQVPGVGWPSMPRVPPPPPGATQTQATMTPPRTPPAPPTAPPAPIPNATSPVPSMTFPTPGLTGPSYRPFGGYDH
jgi:colicin import membrane protein